MGQRALFARLGDARFVPFCPLVSPIDRGFLSVLLSALATGPQQLLKEYLENWLEQVYRPTVRPNTYKQFRSIVHHHLIPAFGHIAVQKLKAERIQAYYAQKLKEGLSPRSVAVIHAVLHSALENAVKWGLVSRNAAKLVTRPRIERYEGQTLTGDQAMKLLEVANSI